MTEPVPSAPPGPEWQAPKKKRSGCLTAIGVVIVLVVVLAIAGALMSGGDDKKDDGGDPPTQAEEVTISGCTTNVLGLVEASGTVTNHSSKRSDYYIDITVLSGTTQIGTGVEIVPNVDAGRTATWTSFTTAKAASAAGIVCKVTKVERNVSL